MSQAVVRVLRQRTGRGPTRARTDISSDLAIVTLEDSLTPAERTLVSEGDRALVSQFRTALHDGMRAEAVTAVEEITGIAFHCTPVSSLKRPMSGVALAQPAGLPPQRRPLKLTIEESASTFVLRIAGELEFGGIGQVMAALDRLNVAHTTQLILDLREVTFLDLAGLKTILAPTTSAGSITSRSPS